MMTESNPKSRSDVMHPPPCRDKQPVNPGYVFLLKFGGRNALNFGI